MNFSQAILLEKLIKQCKLGRIEHVAILLLKPLFLKKLRNWGPTDISTYRAAIGAKIIHTYIAPSITSWRSESSNISLVVLNKLLYYSWNLSFWKIRKQCGATLCQAQPRLGLRCQQSILWKIDLEEWDRWYMAWIAVLIKIKSQLWPSFATWLIWKGGLQNYYSLNNWDLNFDFEAKG